MPNLPDLKFPAKLCWDARATYDDPTSKIGDLGNQKLRNWLATAAAPAGENQLCPRVRESERERERLWVKGFRKFRVLDLGFRVQGLGFIIV